MWPQPKSLASDTVASCSESPLTYPSLGGACSFPEAPSRRRYERGADCWSATEVSSSDAARHSHGSSLVVR